MARVLVVGAGLTGAASAALLRGAPRGHVAVWDKARGAGGSGGGDEGGEPGPGVWQCRGWCHVVCGVMSCVAAVAQGAA